jgi:hydroxyethylthiazole kinase-like uncharacterized protein yjeF
MRLVTSTQMSSADSHAQEQLGIPGAVLMESAATAAWHALVARLPAPERPSKFVFVAGGGNNGGDALAMARLCHIDGTHDPSIILGRVDLADDAGMQLDICRRLGIDLCEWQSNQTRGVALLQSADYIVDGIAGTGLSGSLREPLATIAGFVNESDAMVIALDAPSGVGDGTTSDDPAVNADITLTLGLPKACLFEPAHRAKCGTIQVVPFTLPREAVAAVPGSMELLEEADLRGILPVMASDAHKGTRGIVGVFAGAPGTVGAASLSAWGALSAGAGLVTAYAAETVRELLASSLVSVMVRPELEGLGELQSDTAREHAVVIGPGWGTHEARQQQLRELLAHAERGVIDADGLTALAGCPDLKPGENWILTPHPGELARLLGSTTTEVTRRFMDSARSAAESSGSIVMAKACTTVVAHPDGRIAVVDGMNEFAATAGSGDVLAGVAGALLARGMQPYDAACAAALIHSTACRRLSLRDGFFHSSKLPDEIARVAGSP